MLLLLLVTATNSVRENVRVHVVILLVHVVVLLLAIVLLIPLVHVSRLPTARSGRLAGLRSACRLLLLALTCITRYLVMISVLTVNSLVKILNRSFSYTKTSMLFVKTLINL